MASAHRSQNSFKTEYLHKKEATKLDSKKNGRKILGIVGDVILYTILAMVVIVFVILPFFGFRSNKMWSDSMKPAINTGDMVFTATVPIEKVKVGDIIVSDASGSDDPVIHRVYSRTIENGNVVLETKGDALEETDDWSTTKDNFLGKAYFTFPCLGYVSYFLFKYVLNIFLIGSVLLMFIFRELFLKKENMLSPDD